MLRVVIFDNDGKDWYLILFKVYTSQLTSAVEECFMIHGELTFPIL